MDHPCVVAHSLDLSKTYSFPSRPVVSFPIAAPITTIVLPPISTDCNDDPHADCNINDDDDEEILRVLMEIGAGRSRAATNSISRSCDSIFDAGERRIPEPEPESEPEQVSSIASPNTECPLDSGCLICTRSVPPCLSSRSPSWSAIMHVVLFTLHHAHPTRDYFGLQSDIYPLVDSHWSKLFAQKTNVHKWHKQLQDSMSHKRRLFQSGKGNMGKNGYWRLRANKDPWFPSATDASRSSPSPPDSPVLTTPPTSVRSLRRASIAVDSDLPSKRKSRFDDDRQEEDSPARKRRFSLPAIRLEAAERPSIDYAGLIRDSESMSRQADKLQIELEVIRNQFFAEVTINESILKDIEKELSLLQKVN